MPPPKSKVWQYFSKHIDGGECKLCMNIIISKGGNTTNLAAHLRRKHSIESTPHPSVAGLFKKETSSTAEASTAPKDLLRNMKPLPDLPQLPDLPKLPDTKSPQIAQMANAGDSTTPKSLPTIWERARMGKMDSARQHRITRKIAAYLVKDMRPYSTVESDYFRDMIHACDDRVVIPNKAAFSERIISSWYNMEVSKLMEELKATKHVALTSDCWTSRITIPYLTITAHVIDETYNLKSKVLQTKVLDSQHTGENISVALNSALESWQIREKVSVITTDNASNMGKAIEISDIKLKIGCFAHTLDLAAKKAVEIAKPISKKMKPIISFLHRSHMGAKVLKEKQEALNVPTHHLITDVETRWNSTYLMFERFFEQRVEIHATFLDKRLESNKDVYRDFKDSDILKAEEFIATMKDFYDVTGAVCSEKKPTASLILTLADKVLRKCEIRDGDTEFSKQLKNAIRDNLSKRYQDQTVRDFLLKATALDPRTKTRNIVQDSTWNALKEEVVALMETAEMIVEPSEVQVKLEDDLDPVAKKNKEATKSLIDSLLYEDDDDLTITDSYQRSKAEMAEDEIKKYREFPKHNNALAFWNYHKHTLPNLEKLATKYLVAQATSVAAERVFSTSGDILSAERACLDANSLDAMIFLKKNATKTLISLFN